MNFDKIRTGLTSERVLTIEEKHTVSHTGNAILSTPMMIAFMESISAQMVQGLLPEKFTTVGYEVHVKHKAPARLGSEIKVWSKLQGIDDRKLLFEVKVTQGDKLIGEGLHRRTIIPLTSR